MCYNESTSKRVYFFVQKLAWKQAGLSETEPKRRGKIQTSVLLFEGGKLVRLYRQRNYNTMKNKKNDPDRLEMSKYCRFCKKHTTHKETK